jgi:hypothetical protein
MPYEVIRGFTDVNTSKNPKHLRQDQLAVAVNMEWISENEIYVRRGSVQTRDNTNWPTSYRIDGVTFKTRDAAYYYEISFIADGTIWYVRSDDANFDDVDVTMTEIKSSGNTSPALATNLKVSFDGINNKLILCDGSSNLYWWDGTDNKLHLIVDPTDFEITYTGTGIDATIGDIYSDAADATRKFIVKATVAASTTVVVRQTAGATRTAATGTLNRDSGAGDMTIAFTAVSYSGTYEEVKLYKRRANAVTNEGDIFVSISRNGTNFTGAGSGRLEIDVIEGLRVSNFIPFKRGAVITTEDKLVEKFSISTLTGFKFFDATVPGSEVGQFKVERESKIHGFIGRSGQEIGNLIIGLTKNGFVTFSGEVTLEFGLTASGILSDPIKDQIKNINFEAADKVYSVIDIVNQRYLCAAPIFDSTEANVIFAYDYGKSKDGNARWSVWFMSFGDISSLFNLKNKVYASDLNGNTYQLTVDNIFTDNEEGYIPRIETAALGAESSMIARNWKRVYVDFKVPSEDQELTIYSKLDGQVITASPTGTAIQQVELKARPNNGNLISDYTFIDTTTFISGSSYAIDTQISHGRLGGKGLVEQIGIVSSGVGVNWGITGLMLEYEAKGDAKGQT